MVTHAKLIPRLQLSFAPESQARSIERVQILNNKRSVPIIIRYFRVPSRHKWIVRKYNIRSFPSDDNFLTFQMVDVSDDSLGGELAESRCDLAFWRPKDQRSVL